MSLRCSKESLELAIRQSLIKGCICHINIGVFFRNWSEILKSNQDSDDVLLSVSFINTLLNSVFSGKSEVKLCRNIIRFCHLIKHCKFHILAVLYRVFFNCQNQFIQRECLKLFSVILKNIPCFSNEICEIYCPVVINFFIRNMSLNNKASVGLIYEAINENSSSATCGLKLKQCNHPVILRQETTSHHSQLIKIYAINQIKHEWKKWNGLHQDLEFLNMWRYLVSISSNIGISSCKEIIGSASSLIGDVCICENQDLIWMRKLSILNEVLCYGSTLALQTEIPNDLSMIAQNIVKSVKQNGSLKECGGKNLFIGTMIIENNEIPQYHGDRSSTRSFSLVVFKSIAIVLHQATSCSSGEESDSSHCSRGCLCDEEVDMIEKTMISVLDIIHHWFNQHQQQQNDDNIDSSTSFVNGFVNIFMDQDDHLIEALLCLLDIYTSLSVLSTTRHPLSYCHPIGLFECFMEKCSWDSNVLIDYLLSNETCFLLYFLRLLKFISRQQNSSNEVQILLQQIQNSLIKLQSKNLFPYNIKPILKLLDKIMMNFQENK